MKSTNKLGLFSWFVVLTFVSGLNLSHAADVGVQEGNLIPDFEVENLNGELFRTLDYRGEKPIYLIFWATWCPACKGEVPQFKELYEKMGGKVEIMAVNVDALSRWHALSSSQKRVTRYAEEYDLSYNIALDDDKRLSEMFEVLGTPTQIIIDKEGIIQRRYPILNQETMSTLESVL